MNILHIICAYLMMITQASVGNGGAAVTVVPVLVKHAGIKPYTWRPLSIQASCFIEFVVVLRAQVQREYHIEASDFHMIFKEEPSFQAAGDIQELKRTLKKLNVPWADEIQSEMRLRPTSGDPLEESEHVLSSMLTGTGGRDLIYFAIPFQ